MHRFYDNSAILCNGLGHLKMRVLAEVGILEYLLWAAVYWLVIQCICCLSSDVCVSACLRVLPAFQARDVAQLVEFLSSLTYMKPGVWSPVLHKPRRIGPAPERWRQEFKGIRGQPGPGDPISNQSTRESWWIGWVGKGSCHHACQPDWVQSPELENGGSKKWTPTSCSLASTHTTWCMCSYIYVHITHTKKIF